MMKKHLGLELCCFLGTTLLLAVPASGQSMPEGNKTSGQITVYGWLAGYGGELTPGPGAPTFEVDKGFGELFEDLDGAFFATGLLRHDRFVLVADVAHTSSSKEGDVPTGNPLLPFVPAEGKLKQTSFTVAGGYRVIDNPTITLDLLGGARSWWVRPKVEVPALGISRSADVDFVDPIVAARVNYPMSSRWSALFYADVGGFGAGSKFTGQLVGTINARVTPSIWLSGSYRYLKVNYKSGGVRVDSGLGGPLIGATVTF